MADRNAQTSVMFPAPPQQDYLIGLAEVRRRTTLSTATVYRRMAEGTFPERVRLSVARVAWWESDVQAWLEALRTGERC